MSRNPIKTRESEVSEVIRATFQTLIPKVWYACYQIPKHLIGNYREIDIPVRGETHMTMRFSRSRLEVTYREEVYIVDWACDPRNGQFSDFLLSPNWGTGSGSMFAFPKTITALTLHMVDVARRV